MMGTEMAPEMSVTFNHLTWLRDQDDLIDVRLCFEGCIEIFYTKASYWE
jgi:hypothetical protein